MSLESKAARADRRRRRRLAPPPQNPSVNKPASRPPEGSPLVVREELSDGTLIETFLEYAPSVRRAPEPTSVEPLPAPKGEWVTATDGSDRKPASRFAAFPMPGHEPRKTQL